VDSVGAVVTIQQHKCRSHQSACISEEMRATSSSYTSNESHLIYAACSCFEERTAITTTFTDCLKSPPLPATFVRHGAQVRCTHIGPPPMARQQIVCTVVHPHAHSSGKRWMQ
jgi:hypothetical protein